MKHPFAKSTLFAGLRRAVAWPGVLLLACALLLGGVHVADLPSAQPAPEAVSIDAAGDAHCAGHDTAPAGTTDRAGGGDCCGNACPCAFAQAMGPLPGAMARHAFEPACPVVATAPPLRGGMAVPPLRPPIA